VQITKSTIWCLELRGIGTGPGNSVQTLSAAAVSENIKIGWIATIRGRIGYAMDRVLLYATGGGAFTHTSDNVTATGIGTIFNASSTNPGWTIGAGAEWAFAQNWTARVEYLYVATNVSQSGAIPVVGGTITETGNVHDNLIRAGVNFKFP
jgi:outer membrane immunogenic protein